MNGARHLVAAGAPAPGGAYSHAVWHGTTLYCSAQVGLTPDGRGLAGDTVEEQAAQSLRNLHQICVEAGTSLHRALRLGVFLTDLRDGAKLNEVFLEFFTAGPPARTTVAVSGLPLGARVNIDAIVGADTGGGA
jgi:2-iminobutanoate/2-iminopropanoate deaminase